MQRIVVDIVESLRGKWKTPVRVVRGPRIVAIADNYDRLGYAPDAVARDGRYTRYVDDGHVLRTQTSAMLPPVLRQLSKQPPDDLLLVCPGICYRRDAIDRLHTGEPHQLDLWRIRSNGRSPALGGRDLHQMIETVLNACLPTASIRSVETQHPYTARGLEISVCQTGAWVEVGECGLAGPAVLREAGLTRSHGLAMGLGLDRILMLRKGVDDIRLLRSTDPRIQRQMQDLAPYREVSRMPAAWRDLSIAVDGAMDEELIGDAVRQALGDASALIEQIMVISETPHAELPDAARARLGMSPEQKNVLLRVVIRDLHGPVSKTHANRLRDQIYARLHRGTVHSYASKG